MRKSLFLASPEGGSGAATPPHPILVDLKHLFLRGPTIVQGRRYQRDAPRGQVFWDAANPCVLFQGKARLCCCVQAGGWRGAGGGRTSSSVECNRCRRDGLALRYAVYTPRRRASEGGRFMTRQCVLHGQSILSENVSLLCCKWRCRVQMNLHFPM